jgi:hypothetical protein
MSKVPRRILAVAVGLVLTVAVASPALFASHSWGGYHWARTANPFTLKVGNNVSSAWTTQFNTAVSDWNKSAELGLAPVAGSSGRNCKMVAGTVQVCNRTYGNNGWLGLASINITGGVHITQGSAKMNDTYFNTATYNNPNEKLHVMCQEVGHTFGLGHTSEDGSSQNTCMDYFSNTGANATSTVSTHPNAHDYQELSTIYAHLDTINTATSANAAARAGKSEVDDDDPNSWGELKHQSQNGRSSVYEHHNQDGSRTLTHVHWTLEAAEGCADCDHRLDH